MSSTGISKTPDPPYYVVIFTSARTEGDQGYSAMADRMVELSSQQPGFLGVESAQGADAVGITDLLLGQRGLHRPMESQQ